MMLLQSEIHLRNVNNAIKGATTMDNQEEENNECDDYDELIAGNWTAWADSIYTQAQEIANNSNNGSVVNAYYNVEAAKKIKHLIHYLPLWTGIMKPYFKCGSQIATSSFVEAEFAQLKTRVFKNELPKRVDKFILRHLEYLDGRLRLTFNASNQETILDEAISNLQDSAEVSADKVPVGCINLQESLNEVENW
nr:uncharacterized protein LOC117600474 isoform X2 [Osmia lignaria]